MALRSSPGQRATLSLTEMEVDSLNGYVGKEEKGIIKVHSCHKTDLVTLTPVLKRFTIHPPLRRPHPEHATFLWRPCA